MYFLRTVDASVPLLLDVRLVMDNYGTHKTPISNCSARHPRFHIHFTPTSIGVRERPEARCNLCTWRVATPVPIRAATLRVPSSRSLRPWP